MKPVFLLQTLQQVFIWFHDHTFAVIEAWAALTYLHGLGAYRVTILSEAKIDTRYFRCHCGLSIVHPKHYVEAMAEGRTRLTARVRAVAEAYERLCLVQSGLIERREEHAPFGMAVAWRRKTACAKAFAEYHERKYQHDMLQSLMREGQRTFRNIESPLGLSVWICVCRSTDENWGSGYGLTERQAFDSAQRSAIRRLDFPENCLSGWVEPQNAPALMDLTPSNQPWLECWCYGHIRKS